VDSHWQTAKQSSHHAMADSKADSSYSEEQDTLEDSEVEDAMEE
jgi:hypothetical protein